MPGTPEQKPQEASFFAYANREALRIAGQKFSPVGQAQQFHRTYWIVMAGYGFVPYTYGYTRS